MICLEQLKVFWMVYIIMCTAGWAFIDLDEEILMSSSMNVWEDKCIYLSVRKLKMNKNSTMGVRQRQSF